MPCQHACSAEHEAGSGGCRDSCLPVVLCPVHLTCAQVSHCFAGRCERGEQVPVCGLEFLQGFGVSRTGVMFLEFLQEFSLLSFQSSCS